MSFMMFPPLAASRSLLVGVVFPRSSEREAASGSALEFFQQVNPRRDPLLFHALDHLVNAAVARTGTVARQVDQVAIIVIDFRAAARQIAGHGTVGPP